MRVRVAGWVRGYNYEPIRVVHLAPRHEARSRILACAAGTLEGIGSMIDEQTLIMISAHDGRARTVGRSGLPNPAG